MQSRARFCPCSTAPALDLAGAGKGSGIRPGSGSGVLGGGSLLHHPACCRQVLPSLPLAEGPGRSRALVGLAGMWRGAEHTDAKAVKCWVLAALIREEGESQEESAVRGKRFPIKHPPTLLRCWSPPVGLPQHLPSPLQHLGGLEPALGSILAPEGGDALQQMKEQPL